MCRSAWNWGAKAGLFYAGTNLLCNIWCWFRLPETKDRTFGEIDLLFENNVPARKFKYTKVDRKLIPPQIVLYLSQDLVQQKLIQIIEFAHQRLEKDQIQDEKPGVNHLEDKMV